MLGLWVLQLLLLLLLLVVVVVVVVVLLLLLLLLFIILYCAPLTKKKKEKDCTAYDVEVVCLTMEIKVRLIEPKYEQHVSRS